MFQVRALHKLKLTVGLFIGPVFACFAIWLQPPGRGTTKAIGCLLDDGWLTVSNWNMTHLDHHLLPSSGLCHQAIPAACMVKGKYKVRKVVCWNWFPKNSVDPASHPLVASPQRVCGLEPRLLYLSIYYIFSANHTRVTVVRHRYLRLVDPQHVPAS